MRLKIENVEATNLHMKVNFLQIEIFCRKKMLIKIRIKKLNFIIKIKNTITINLEREFFKI